MVVEFADVHVVEVDLLTGGKRGVKGEELGLGGVH